MDDEEEQKDSVVLEQRTRAQKTTLEKNRSNEERNQHQEHVYKKNLDENKRRHERGELQFKDASAADKDPESLCANASADQMPKNAKEGQIFVDAKHEVLLAPMGDRLVPFHLETVKNVSHNVEGALNYLRINFTVPTQANQMVSGPEAVFIKELTFKAPIQRNLGAVMKQIKDCLKSMKIAASASGKGKDKKNVVYDKVTGAKGPKPLLDNVIIRPTIEGKKTVGQLEGHVDGVRFIGQKGSQICFLYSNIASAILQPCEADLIVLLHFRLVAPIIVGSKATSDVQFYTEVGHQVDDLDYRAGRKKLSEADELEQEHREKQHKTRLNNKFKRFAEDLQAQAKRYKFALQFDIPYHELEFTGCYAKASSRIFPTADSIVSLTEQPFLVVPFGQIELCHFERVQFSLKNFDMVLVFKDFSTFQRIGSIPKDQLDTIKFWLE